ncbi:MAG: hypothetical protein R6W77_15950 [Trueperaceae bacterium]
MRRLIALALVGAVLSSCTTGAPPAAPTIGAFTAAPNMITLGDSTTLSWTVSGAVQLSVHPGNVDVTGSTSLVVSPVATTSYVLTATNAAGSVQASTSVTVDVTGESEKRTVLAAEGGTITVGGATLVIPPDALDFDTEVTLSVGAPASQRADDPLQAAGPLVSVDLGGAALLAAATLQAPYVPASDVFYVIAEDTEVESGELDGVRIRAAPGAVEGGARFVPGEDRAPLTMQDLATVAFEIFDPGRFTVTVIPRPTEGVGSLSLQVPFYWQAGYPWCSPTAVSMALNYFQPLPGFEPSASIPGGRLSNFYLASLLDQDATSGAWVASFLEAAGVPTERYSWLRWDADLIPSDEFSAYVVLTTTGVFGLFPQKPLITTSDAAAHAFVITGLSADGIYINDSNARWNGTHPSLTWEQFRTQNQLGTVKEELGTLMVFGDPRPENERRGSLEIAPPTGEDASRTIRFRNASGSTVSNWMWDAQPFEHGYFFDDQSGRGMLKADAEFGRVVPRSSQLDTSFNIVNVTNLDLTYDVYGRVYLGGALKVERSALDVAVGSYERERIDFGFGDLGGLAGAITAPVDGRLEIELRQGGILQDIKAIEFKLGPNPEGAPTPSIERPSYGITTLLNVPLDFIGSAYDPWYITSNTGNVDASRLSWWQGGTMLAGGKYMTRSHAAVGQYTYTLRAVGEYGEVATKDLLVNVIDPTPEPGAVVIDYPANGAGFGYYNEMVLNLVGHAFDADGSAVPGDRLFWKINDGFGDEEIGTGTSQAVMVYGHCTGRTYTITMTARKGDGSPIGSKVITIEVTAPPC